MRKKPEVREGEVVAKRLHVDLDKCDTCRECTSRCEYIYRTTEKDRGILSVREMATFAVVCRRCQEPLCVAACRFEALERDKEGVLTRHNMRCVGCRCCANACPFGTIYAEVTPFYAVRCDYCENLRGGEPACVASCEKHAVEYLEEGSTPEGGHVVAERLTVRGPKWTKKEQ